MRCLNPMLLERPGLPAMIVPCGQCRECRRLRQTMWAMRLMHEREMWPDAVFVTLTYNDQHLPADGELCPADPQLFLKRLRARIAPLRIKYYLCGEYGAQRGRPHYHLIIFGVNDCYVNIIEKEWAWGFVKVGPVNIKTCRYVAKYLTKNPLGRRFDRENHKTLPYQRCSRGIGLSWVMANADTVGSRGISRHGRQVSLPRYYLRKLRERGFLQDRVTEDARVESLRVQVELIDRLTRDGVTLQDYNLTRLEEIKTMDEMYKPRDQDGQ